MPTEYEKLRERMTAARTPLAGSAMLGGPQPSQLEQQASQAERGVISPAQVAEGQMPQPTAGGAGLAQLGLETAGSIAGGPLGGFFASKVGSRLLGPMALRGATYLARVGGSAAGSLAGSEAATAFAEETPQESAQRQRRALVQGIVGEAAQPAVRLLARPLMRKLRGGAGTEAVVGAREVQDALRAVGASATPGQLLEGWVDILENVGESSIIGGQVVRKAREAGAQGATRLWQNTIANFASNVTKEQAGRILQVALKNTADVQRSLTRSAYKALDTKILGAGGQPAINLHPVLRDAEDLLGVLLEVDDPIAQKIVRLVRAGAKTKPGGLGMPPTPLLTDFATANEIRSYLDSLSRTDQALIPGVKALAGKVARDVDTAMKAGMLKLGTLGQEVLDAAAIARSTAKFGKDTFNDELIGQLIGKAAPEDAAKLLFQNASPSRIAAVERILFNPKFASAIPNPKLLWNQVRGAYLADHLSVAAGAGPAEFGHLSGTALMRQLRSAGGTLKALFPDSVAQRSLYTSARALELTQGKTGSSVGSIFIGLKQASAVAQFASLGFIGYGGGAAKGSAAILIAPWAISQAISRPAVANFLLKWAETRAGRAGATSAEFAAQLGARLINEGDLPFSVRDDNGNVTEFPGGLPPAPTGAAAKAGLKPVSKMEAPR